MTIPTSRDSDRFMLRLPDGMRDKIKDAASENGRSMNAEMVARLERSFVSDEIESTEDLRQRLATIRDIIREHEQDIREMYEPEHS